MFEQILKSQALRDPIKIYSVTIETCFHKTYFASNALTICKKVSNKESDDYFHSRPRGSQISALASKQSETLESYEGLLEKAKQIESDNEGKDIKRPDRWGGFVLKPNLFEFWTNQENRLHKSELFTLNEEGWEKSLIYP